MPPGTTYPLSAPTAPRYPSGLSGQNAAAAARKRLLGRASQAIQPDGLAAPVNWGEQPGNAMTAGAHGILTSFQPHPMAPGEPKGFMEYGRSTTNPSEIYGAPQPPATHPYPPQPEGPSFMDRVRGALNNPVTNMLLAPGEALQESVRHGALRPVAEAASYPGEVVRGTISRMIASRGGVPSSPPPYMPWQPSPGEQQQPAGQVYDPPVETPNPYIPAGPPMPWGPSAKGYLDAGGRPDANAYLREQRLQGIQHAGQRATYDTGAYPRGYADPYSLPQGNPANRVAINQTVNPADVARNALMKRLVGMQGDPSKMPDNAFNRMNHDEQIAFIKSQSRADTEANRIKHANYEEYNPHTAQGRANLDKYQANHYGKMLADRGIDPSGMSGGEMYQTYKNADIERSVQQARTRLQMRQAQQMAAIPPRVLRYMQQNGGLPGSGLGGGTMAGGGRAAAPLTPEEYAHQAAGQAQIPAEEMKTVIEKVKSLSANPNQPALAQEVKEYLSKPGRYNQILDHPDMQPGFLSGIAGLFGMGSEDYKKKIALQEAMRRASVGDAKYKQMQQFDPNVSAF